MTEFSNHPLSVSFQSRTHDVRPSANHTNRYPETHNRRASSSSSSSLSSARSVISPHPLASVCARFIPRCPIIIFIIVFFLFATRLRQLISFLIRISALSPASPHPPSRLDVCLHQLTGWAYHFANCFAIPPSLSSFLSVHLCNRCLRFRFPAERPLS